jgi:predicted alpha/beta hydrolase
LWHLQRLVQRISEYLPAAWLRHSCFPPAFCLLFSRCDVMCSFVFSLGLVHATCCGPWVKVQCFLMFSAPGCVCGCSAGWRPRKTFGDTMLRHCARHRRSLLRWCRKKGTAVKSGRILFKHVLVCSSLVSGSMREGKGRRSRVAGFQENISHLYYNVLHLHL